ncbi:hypothetical protein VB712_03650 [Spirulina sp. CCNP1310]|uniref:hypothetical protein n=1 Tax=Spirulina sp. CCNP1310 TaxID=3110249 RepID=UPI002B20B8CB|nr:hypothetical protein [Spirulina sp. CCNP1310]MEA5418306.1 hypothetical protein [Spirulina sp. CCNP1310]
MSEELVQWLAEIRTLKQSLAEAERDRDAAQASATHWRKLYNTEARQRREELKLAQTEITKLQGELEAIKTPPPTHPAQAATFAAELAALRDEAQLRQKLIAVLQERDRALDALRQEQENHRYTRQNLTSVIGDTMEQLTLLRGGTLPKADLEESDDPAAIALVDVMPPEVRALLEQSTPQEPQDRPRPKPE